MSLRMKPASMERLRISLEDRRESYGHFLVAAYVFVNKEWVVISWKTYTSAEEALKGMEEIARRFGPEDIKLAE